MLATSTGVEMAQFGWILLFEPPKGLDKLATKEEKIGALQDHIKRCFEQVEPLMINGLRFASKQEYIGTACIVGPRKECLRLKEEITKMGIGKMIANTDRIRPA